MGRERGGGQKGLPHGLEGRLLHRVLKWAAHGQVCRFVSVMIPLTGRRAGGVRGGGRQDWMPESRWFWSQCS